MQNALFKERNDVSAFRGNLQAALLEKIPFIRAMQKHGRRLVVKGEENVKLRHVRQEDYGEIAAWVQDEQETMYLGEREYVDATTIAQWAGDAYVALVLDIRDQPTAFCTFAPIPEKEKHWELGRMVVNPAWRKKGVGVFLLKYLSMQINKAQRRSEEWPVILSRVHEENEAGQEMMNRLINAQKTRRERGYMHWREHNPPEEERDHCVWYRLF